jgi:lysophospholipase L1-like esterase
LSRLTRRAGRGRGLLAAIAALGIGIAAQAALAAETITVEPADAVGTKPLPMAAHGRVVADGTELRRQWPGSYFDTAFRGADVFFKLGAGDVALRILVDGQPVAALTKPRPGVYRVRGLGAGQHSLRVAVASESQAGATVFGGFFAAPGTAAAPLPHRGRQIEFIGDSHTVGYGNSSSKGECSQDEVWATTDTTRAFGPILASRYGADVQINAISGRGVVRNYNGFTADTLIEAYPYALLDHQTPVQPQGWSPQLIVIALGTNDFTTALHDGEKWPNRDALHADYEATYARFVRSLRARHPHAFIVLWATDMANGEIEAEAGKVAAALAAAGDRRVAFLPVDGLGFTGCHGHPSLADDATIAAKLAGVIDRQADVWRR